MGLCIGFHSYYTMYNIYAFISICKINNRELEATLHLFECNFTIMRPFNYFWMLLWNKNNNTPVTVYTIFALRPCTVLIYVLLDSVGWFKAKYKKKKPNRSILCYSFILLFRNLKIMKTPKIDITSRHR